MWLLHHTQEATITASADLAHQHLVAMKLPNIACEMSSTSLMRLLCHPMRQQQRQQRSSADSSSRRHHETRVFPRRSCEFGEKISIIKYEARMCSIFHVDNVKTQRTRASLGFVTAFIGYFARFFRPHSSDINCQVRRSMSEMLDETKDGRMNERNTWMNECINAVVRSRGS